MPAVFLKPSCRPHKVKQLHESGTSMVASKPAMLLCPQTSWEWQGTGRSLPAFAIKASGALALWSICFPPSKEHDEFCFAVCCRENGTVCRTPAMTSAFWSMRHALEWPISKPWSPQPSAEMPANLAGRKLGSAEPAAWHSPPRRTSALCFRAPQSLIRRPTACSPMRRGSAHMVRDHGPFRADREVGSHLLLG